MESSALVSQKNNWSTQLRVACFASLVAASSSGVALHLALKNQSEAPNIRFLLADDWVGKPWPIDEHFDDNLKLIKTGKWLALIFRSDCEHCKALSQRIEESPQNSQVSELKIVSFVAGSNIWPVHFEKATTVSESPFRIQWSGEEPFVASPAAFLLLDGDIIEAKDGEKADELVARVLNLPKASRGDQ